MLKKEEFMGCNSGLTYRIHITLSFSRALQEVTSCGKLTLA